MIEKKNNLIILGLIILVAIFILPKLGLFAVSGTTALTRSVSSEVTGGSTFIVTYNTVNAPIGKWFVAWDDTITGGCTPTNYKSFMVSETGGDSSITKTFTAPASGSCTFGGFYQYAGGLKVNFANLVIPICNRNTPADTNCDGIVSFSELTAYANLWVSGSVTFDNLIIAAQVWVGS